MTGAISSDILVRARSALLDVLEALDEQRDAVIVVGAQAVYLRTGSLKVALAETTKDSDVTIDPRELHDDPLLEAAMRRAGFLPTDQPGAWVRPDGIPIDLMIPERLAGKGRRSAEIPPHDKHATRRAVGLEAALVDNSEMFIRSLDPQDSRSSTAKVAGNAALLVAKLHKIGERVDDPERLQDKDAHDLYRILQATETADLAHATARLLADDLSRKVTEVALSYLKDYFASGPDAIGSAMAGRAEQGVGDPDTVSVSTALLAQDLIDALSRGDAQKA
ncbi:hypothetical protein GCM10010922_27270 [Microbacterium sorbitolivorans]|uniref:Nucleotidyltransferase n=1 Tax=Microbacterium sorbitolivorans TaxID=1867410 RepID=A0A367XTM4_9MICO|nr:hypothetical protein [Microbacterium sorbitolivorans]RCK56924.1 hypothetical protein DTO57_13685 [Microbacterium sorbitolivorans]GGF49854.1 hypothetical protein GCM10010922_27270 [Microbacterium sorbitolivorans]